MQVDILNIQGEKTGRTLELPDDIFGIEPNDHVIYLAVKQYQAAQRQGTWRRAFAWRTARDYLCRRFRDVEVHQWRRA